MLYVLCVYNKREKHQRITVNISLIHPLLIAPSIIIIVFVFLLPLHLHICHIVTSIWSVSLI
jgi:hypothetical protein